jgi:hypothetical protein
MTQETHLVSRADDYMCASKEFSDGSRMGMKKALLGLWDAVPAPVDLHKLGELRLRQKQSQSRRMKQKEEHIDV